MKLAPSTSKASSSCRSTQMVDKPRYKQLPRAIQILRDFNSVGVKPSLSRPVGRKRKAQSIERFGFVEDFRPNPSNYSRLLSSANSDIRKLQQSYRVNINKRRASRKKLWDWEPSLTATAATDLGISTTRTRRQRPGSMESKNDTTNACENHKGLTESPTTTAPIEEDNDKREEKRRLMPMWSSPKVSKKVTREIKAPSETATAITITTATTTAVDSSELDQLFDPSDDCAPSSLDTDDTGVRSTRENQKGLINTPTATAPIEEDDDAKEKKLRRRLMRSPPKRNKKITREIKARSGRPLETATATTTTTTTADDSSELDQVFDPSDDITTTTTADDSSELDQIFDPSDECTLDGLHADYIFHPRFLPTDGTVDATSPCFTTNSKRVRATTATSNSHAHLVETPKHTKKPKQFPKPRAGRTSSSTLTLIGSMYDSLAAKVTPGPSPIGNRSLCISMKKFFGEQGDVFSMSSESMYRKSPSSGPAQSASFCIRKEHQGQAASFPLLSTLQKQQQQQQQQQQQKIVEYEATIKSNSIPNMETPYSRNSSNLANLTQQTITVTETRLIGTTQQKLQQNKNQSAFKNPIFHSDIEAILEQGLTASGEVLPSTPVVFEDPIYHNHLFFRCMSRNSVKYFPLYLHQRLLGMEREMDAVLTAAGELGDKQRYDLGIRIEDYVGMKKGSSLCGGSLFCDNFIIKRHPKLYIRIVRHLESIIHHAFKDEPWYKRMKTLCRQLNQQTCETRTIGNMPVSCIRRMSFNQYKQAIESRDDANYVGSAFVLSTFPNEAQSFQMVTAANDGGGISIHYPKPGLIHGGAWNSDPPLFRFKSSVPIFWVLCLDNRVFSSRYAMKA